MPRNPYTENEIILCAYIALYGRALFIEKKISTSHKRSEASIIMKVQNIAAMLDEKGISRNQDISSLSGVTTGQDGRRTNWDIVSKMIELGKDEHKLLCKEIIRHSMSR
jgi:hypothetical protein